MAHVEVTCPECGEGVYEESDFCPHCGILREPAGEPVCAEHPEDDATEVCIICHRLLCPRCRKRRQGKSFCALHQKVEVVLDWACVFKASDPAATELARSVLVSGGFTVMRQNLESGGVWGGALVRPSTVFVPIPEYFAAQEALAEWRRAREIDEGDRDLGRRRREIEPDDER
jgi:hypothetical protein